MKKSTGKLNLFKLIQILAVIGVLLSSYLLWQQIARPSFQICNINSFINCDAVITGPVATTFGISTPLYGLIGYIAIFAVSVLRMKKTILGFALGGLSFCLWIAYQDLFILKVICPICILCQANMITIFALAFTLLKKPSKS